MKSFNNILTLRGANIKITKDWLELNGACSAGKEWFLSQKSVTIKTVVAKLISQSKFDWANWILTRNMTHSQDVKYACFCAYKSLENFEKIFPEDKRPRLAIECALKWVQEPTEENKSAAWKIILGFGLKLLLTKTAKVVFK